MGTLRAKPFAAALVAVVVMKVLGSFVLRVEPHPDQIAVCLLALAVAVALIALDPERT